MDTPTIGSSLCKTSGLLINFIVDEVHIDCMGGGGTVFFLFSSNVSPILGIN